jgi:hypothetical protein
VLDDLPRSGKTALTGRKWWITEFDPPVHLFPSPLSKKIKNDGTIAA